MSNPIPTSEIVPTKSLKADPQGYTKYLQAKLPEYRVNYSEKTNSISILPTSKSKGGFNGSLEIKDKTIVLTKFEGGNYRNAVLKPETNPETIIAEVRKAEKTQLAIKS